MEMPNRKEGLLLSRCLRNEKQRARALTKLLRNGNDVLITTKPRLTVIKKIDQLFHEYSNHVQFRFTITSNNERLIEFWEPNAPSFEERMRSLRYAFSNEYKTSVSIEPFLDYNPRALAEMVERYSTESIWIGKMNYIRRHGLRKQELSFYKAVRANYAIYHLKEIYEALREYPKIRFKDSIRNRLALCTGLRI